MAGPSRKKRVKIKRNKAEAGKKKPAQTMSGSIMSFDA
jgi:hypothetical protein